MRLEQKNMPEEYTHGDYRAVEVARILNANRVYEFYYQGKLISKEKADNLVRNFKHVKQKQNRRGNRWDFLFCKDRQEWGNEDKE